MRRCIYCRDEKADAAFNREHVMPEAFGTFAGNLVVACVCTQCNQFFGDGIDRKLARDTIEAIDRVRLGIKKPSEWKGEGTRSTTYFEFDQDGPFRGARGHHIASEAGAELGVTTARWVGFSQPPRRSFDWWPLDNLPTKDELIAKGYKRGEQLGIQVEGEPDSEKVRAALRAKGFDVGALTQTPPRQTGRVHGETVFTVSRPEFRAVTKIALNYFAIVAGPDTALLPKFDDARRFVRYDEPKRNVPTFMNPWFDGSNGHYTSLTRYEEFVVVQLSILLRLQYFVKLSSDGRDVPFTPAAHFFDLDTKTVSSIDPLPLVHGPPLTPSPAPR